ncbi:hypothetical protein Patl1_09156 [Pistacia atlantica]|uniref:Uncharacterized protein n=1 Tax=Pistacia atlantica TaxID=434234 RepID=A0ACC1AJQ8_9ROSI|nr:hypothetical protein Patl1_09156 [Pistacia atlantica]
MGCDVAEAEFEGQLRDHCTIKVHRLMCLELKKLIQRISHIISDIESARPRCTSGLQTFCSFQQAMDKANSLIQHCSQCSKLYLAFSNLHCLVATLFLIVNLKAMTADRIQMRFERVRNSLELGLCQIQNIVPPLLAEKISGIIRDLRRAKFPLEPSEEEVGKGLLSLLRQDISASGIINQLELETLQLAALRLNITSKLALLIERRSLKRLLDEVSDTDFKKRKVLKYLLYLLKKYGGLIWQHKTKSTHAPLEGSYRQSIKTEPRVNNVWDETQVNESVTLEPPEEFKCPISLRLMYDPVVIASGKTFERVWIEKWINEGHNMCPKTLMRLDDLSLIPNLAMKRLISKWCLEHGITIPQPDAMPPLHSSWKASSSYSISSFGSSIDNLCLQVSNVSLPSSDTGYSSDLSNGKTNDGFGSMQPRVVANSQRHLSSMTRDGTDLTFLPKLAFRPWGSQCDAVENVRKQLKENDQCGHLVFSNSYMKPLINFLKDAHDFSDVKAQKDGAEVLLAVLSHSRDEMPPFLEDEFFVLASFLDSEITQKALEIIEVLSCQQCYKSGLVASGILPSILKVLGTEIREFHELCIKILHNLSCDSNIFDHILYLDCIPRLVHFLEDPILARYCIEIINVLCSYEEARTAVAQTNLSIILIAKLLETGTKEEQEHIVGILLSLCYERAEFCEVAMTGSIIQALIDISVNGNSRGQVTAKELLRLLEHEKEVNASECSVADTAKDKKRPSQTFGLMGRKLSRFMHVKH